MTAAAQLWATCRMSLYLSARVLSQAVLLAPHREEPRPLEARWTIQESGEAAKKSRTIVLRFE